MAVKYVKDFAFDSGFGFSGSSGKTPVKSHMRSPMKKADGGAVKSKGFDNSTRNPISKFPDIAPAMVEKRSQGLGGLTPQTKKLASYDKPHTEGKKGAKVAQYAKGGAVKKAHAKKPMPSFLKAKMMKKAEGGPVAEITEGDGMSPLQAMAESDLRVPPLPPVKREFVMPPEFNEEGMRMGPDRGGSRMYDPTSPFAPELMQEPTGLLQPVEAPQQRDSGGPEPIWSYLGMTKEEFMRQAGQPGMSSPKTESYGRLETGPGVPLAGDEPPIGVPLAGDDGMVPGRVRAPAPLPSPLARAAMPTKADRMATRRDNMMAARDIMDRYIAGDRNAMPRRSMAPGMRGIAESKARRAMPVAPRAPMIQLPREPQGGIATFAKGGKVTKGERKIGKVMGEFKRGELHSGSKKGPVVTNPKQATAIALSEVRAAGAKIPKRKAMGGKACG